MIVQNRVSHHSLTTSSNCASTSPLDDSSGLQVVAGWVLPRIVLIDLLHVVIAGLGISCITPIVPQFLFNARTRLVHKVHVLLLLSSRLDALVDPTGYLTRIVVRIVTFECKLATLGTFARNLACGSKLGGRSQALLDLLDLVGLEVDWLIDAFSVLHLLNFVATWNLAWLLDVIYARVTLRIGAWVMEIYRICWKEVHLVFTCLAKTACIDRGKLERFWCSKLATFTICDDSCRMMCMLLKGVARWIYRFDWSEVIITLQGVRSLLLGNLFVRVGWVWHITVAFGGSRSVQHGLNLLVLLAVVTIDAVSTISIAQVWSISPLLRSSTSRKNRCLIIIRWAPIL